MKANQQARNNGMSSDINDGALVGIHDIFIVMLIVVIGLALVPTVQTSTNATLTAVGASTSAGAIANLVPLLFVVLIVIAIVAYFKFG